MRRLNVQLSQIEECIRSSMFALDALPANPPLYKGEALLLQLVKVDAAAHDLLKKRIQFALIFDKAVPDPTGAISKKYWPHAGKTWRFILYCSETVPCLPFSLEGLGLERDYAGMANPMTITPRDEARIRPFLKGETAPERLLEVSSLDDLISTLRNYDRVVALEPPPATRVREHSRRLGDPWLGNTLKTLYRHRCQICLHDFKPRYNVAYAETRFITPLDGGGTPISTNTVVICPNHNAIITAARAEFHSTRLEFTYPNGLIEKLALREHLLQ